MKTVAVILAAGNSTRMGFPKQLAVLNGLPVLARTLLNFQNTDAVDGILLVARPEHFDPFSELCKQHRITKLIGLCPGGDTRQQSAQNSIKALPEDTDFIAVHDGARPLATPTLIERVITAAKKSGAAAAAVPVKDTIKRVDAADRVTETVDRAALRQVQTPQVFKPPSTGRRLPPPSKTVGISPTTVNCLNGKTSRSPSWREATGISRSPPRQISPSQRRCWISLWFEGV